MAHPITRSTFRESRLYLCALAFKKRRDEERLKNLRELLVRVDAKTKFKAASSATKKRDSNLWVIPDTDATRGERGQKSREDEAILAADKDESSWVFVESEGEYVLTLGGIKVMAMPSEMYDWLKPFQRDAVQWIAQIGPIGGILGDEMGMGKTPMSIAALGARMRVKRVRMALVVAPVSVLGVWADESKRLLSKFVQSVRIVKVHGGDRKSRQETVRNAWRDASTDRPYLIISSYSLVCSPNNMNTFLPPSGRHWDDVILDEAHGIKNHTSDRSKCCRRICHKKGTRRLLLTGTPFQNNLTELWSIMNMATGNRVLGKLKEFRREYGKPIKDARCRNASAHAMREGQKANDALQETLKPYLLRRLRMAFLKNELGVKRDTCVWVKSSKQQQQMYKETLESNYFLVRDMLSEDSKLANKARSKCAFQVLRALQAICGHPLHDIGSALEQTALSEIIRGSPKLELTIHMVKCFQAAGHRTLLFSQSTKNLDIIQYVLLKKLLGLKVGRLDGNVLEKRREDVVKLFQEGLFDVLLLSMGAGGVGLTLTRACRVIVYDPSWNPSQEAQAMDRAYRIGQTQEVRVYRLFFANTVEEKMYEKQVHKTGLETTIFTEGSRPEARYFDKHELCKVFAQVPDGSSELLKRFEREGVAQVSDADAPLHNLVAAHGSVVGISDHNAIYSQKRKSAFSDTAAVSNKRFKEEDGEEEEMDTSATEEEPTLVLKPAPVLVSPGP